MHQRLIPLAATVLILSGSAVFAQCSCSSPPVYTSAVPSAVTYEAAPAGDYAPTAYASNYAAPVTYEAAPVTYETAMPYVSYYAPATAYAPVPYVSYYAPAAPYATYYAPATVPAPVVVPYAAYYGVPGWSVYGTPRVYVPGEPVRNALRAVTP